MGKCFFNRYFGLDWWYIDSFTRFYFTQASGDGGFLTVDLTLPGDFAFNTNNGMVPEDGSTANNKRQALVSLGSVTVTT